MLTLYKLMSPQRHTLSQTRHYEGIRSGQQAQIHRERQFLRME